ncbi:Cell wall-associated hydrolase, NlpC family [Natronincola peptidivorans]|uniref:Cell wall-associated hydrolase, NlpC family n=1 Tax=Natronincola peptidivorans TaxID=426128 RepID=A0A1H9Z233_9FIRM|nr:NlpC/P60 family protein [Natronincola peptidivorans]SES75543.1 Cell wall-associated hydrolase, NlpC family [Natronincola peptidivorans]
MKRLKISKIPVVLSIVLVIIFISTSTALADGKLAMVIANQGILREKPEVEGKVIQLPSIGTEVLIRETKNNWNKVVLVDNGVQGWMHEDFLAITGEESKPIKKGIVNVNNVLNLRSTPSTSGSILSQLRNGTELIVLNQANEWYEIQLKEGTKGFVHSDFILLIPNYPHGIIVENNSKIKEKANNESKTIITLSKNDDIYIKKYMDGWYNVLTKDFQEGWLKSDSVDLQINIGSPVSRSGTRSHPLSNIKEHTEKYLGKPYRYAATGPNNFDCSGFVYYVLNKYYPDYLRDKGIKLQRTSRDQATMGTPINKNELQIGDLVFFNNGRSSTISHVGIYIGNDEFIHSSSTNNRGIIISSLKDGPASWSYQSRYVSAVRL